MNRIVLIFPDDPDFKKDGGRRKGVEGKDGNGWAWSLVGTVMNKI